MNNNNPEEPVDPAKHHFETLHLMSFDETDNMWVCNDPDCNRKLANRRGMATHVGMCHVKLRSQPVKKYCAYCPRHYDKLEDLLKHLKIIVGELKKGERKNATCYAIPREDTRITTWGKILDRNAEAHQVL